MRRRVCAPRSCVIRSELHSAFITRHFEVPDTFLRPAVVDRSLPIAGTLLRSKLLIRHHGARGQIDIERRQSHAPLDRIFMPLRQWLNGKLFATQMSGSAVRVDKRAGGVWVDGAVLTSQFKQHELRLI